MSGSPAVSADIISKIATSTLLALLPQFNGNDNVTLALDARIRFANALFKDPSNVPFSLKAEYMGQTVVQFPDVSAQVVMRPQDPSKLFAAGDAGKLKLQLISGTSDGILASRALLK